jgi:hypothetical protein
MSGDAPRISLSRASITDRAAALDSREPMGYADILAPESAFLSIAMCFLLLYEKRTYLDRKNLCALSSSAISGLAYYGEHYGHLKEAGIPSRQRSAQSEDSETRQGTDCL